MDLFLDALRDRGIPEENLEKMLHDKVDQDVAMMMDEETLSKYIPHFGDRVFAKNWTSSSSAVAGTNAEKKKILIERLRSKMKLPSCSQASKSSASHTRQGYGLANKNAERKTRKIELGWMNYQNGYFRQVRRPTGGGTREIIARKDDTIKKILENGKKIFFPNGKSPKGRADDFDFTMCVMGSEEPLLGTVTIGKLYETTHHQILRLYVCSKKRGSDESDSSDFSVPVETPDRSQTTDLTERSQTVQALNSLHLPPTSSFDITLPHSSSTSLTWESPLSSSSPVMHESGPILNQSLDEEVIFLGDDGNPSIDVICDTVVYEPSASEELESDDVPTDIEHYMTEVTSSIPSPKNHVSRSLSTGSESATLEIINQEACSDHTSTTSSANNFENFFDNPENIVEKQVITIRAVDCVSDMIQAFSNENILDANIEFRRIMQSGEMETGVGSGLVRDCLTDFWNTFYTSRTSGTTYKIPNLYHAFQEKQWKAVARIVAFGWQRFKYLPIQLAPPFLYEVLSVSWPNCNLMETFFNYMSPTEKDVLLEALNDFEGADMEELLTILSSHNCSTLPTKHNLQRLLEEIAHKELVQQPAFIIKCWKPVLESIGKSLSGGVLDKILSDLQPKARSVTKYINFPESLSPAERATSHHLLRFVRELEQRELGLFLRFCTGCDLFLSKTIEVAFTDTIMSEVCRRPVAHTCTCLLEIATNYSTYSDFKSEFLSVLQSGVWVMDMI